MTAVSTSEMRMIDGGVGFGPIGLGWTIGKAIGVTARIAYEHIRYGHCITYANVCFKCR